MNLGWTLLGLMINRCVYICGLFCEKFERKKAKDICEKQVDLLIEFVVNNHLPL